MRLTIFNGSPRLLRSNTKYFLECFLEGFESAGGVAGEVLYIYNRSDFERGAEAFAAAECVLLAFPLYVDAMPSRVMAFFESLQPLCGREGNPPLGFFVQSGFPEAFHSRYVERYLEKLARRLGCRHVGAIVKGGGEGIQQMPRFLTRRVLARFRELGRRFGETGEFDRELLRKISGPERFGFVGRMLMRLLLPVTDSLWNSQLKKNSAFERRLARPLEERGRPAANG